jgi:hypothetical protein
MKPVYLSATQIDNFKRCPRLWAWDKIARIPRTPHQATELGSRVHDILEAYYQRKGTPDPTETWRFKPDSKLFYPGQIAASMISDAIPASAVDKLQAEMEFKTEINGIVYVGKIDVHWVEYCPDYRMNILHVVDHKTSSDPAQWGKKESDLENDTQRILYAKAGLELYPEVEKVVFTLNYGSTKLQKSKNYTVSHSALAYEIRHDFETKIEPFARYMVEQKTAGTDPLKLDPNPSACGVFGGCPHVDRCQLSTKQRIGALIMGDSSYVNDILARAKAKKAETGAEPEPKPETTPVNPPEQTEPEPKPEPKPEPVEEKPKKKRTPKPKQEPTPEPTYERVALLPTSMAFSREAVELAAIVGELVGMLKENNCDKYIDGLKTRAMKLLGLDF